MKIVKYLFLLLLLVVGGVCIMGAMQPNDFDVKRTKVINAPVAMEFNYINEYKHWQDWGPWMEEDPSIVATYPEQTSGVGAGTVGLVKTVLEV